MFKPWLKKVTLWLVSHLTLRGMIKPSIVHQVHNACLQIALQDARIHLIGTVATTILGYWLFHNPKLQWQAYIWWGICIPLVLINWVLIGIFDYQRHRFNLKQWEAIVFTVYLCWAAVWALAPWLFLQSETNPFLILIMFLIMVSICSTVVQAAAVFPLTYIAHVSVMMTSAHFFFINMEKGDLTVLQQSVTDWVVPFYALFLIVYMFKLRETLVSNVVLRIENEQASMNKSQFMAAASHDIRQPLQAANFYCEALKKQGETSHVLSQLGGCLDNMSILLDNILDVSKLDAQVVNNVPVHLSLADLFANLEREFRPLAQAKGLIISFEHNDSCVYADQILLERVLCNLISNAISYTLAGEVTVVAKSKAYSVEVSVTDTGIGIDKAEQQAIFDEFYQINNPERDRNKGLGLGLSIVKRHCELMHVELNMDSSLGKGARISLELKQGSNEKIKMPDEAEHQMNVQCKIALIDDEKIIRESLSAMLKEWDMQCMAFVDAESAMQYMTEQQWLPELIIADYRLKDHQTGSEAIKHICTELDCDIPALLLTGDTHPERIREAKATGFHVVHKPVKPATLRTAIHLMIK